MTKCCKPCRLCDRLIISAGVSFADANLVINLPAGSYGNGCRYCIVVAQSIPDAATINAPVYVTIGADTTLYPLQRCNCTQATACQIRTRTKYPVTVVTSAAGGAFKLAGKLPCAPDNAPASLSGAAAAGGGA